MTKDINLKGGCHCGAVRFRFAVPSRDVELLDCNCSMCSRSGFLHLIVAHADFELLTSKSALTSYRFGSGAAEHLFCSTCGVKAFYQPRSHREAWSVNYRCLDREHGLVPTIRTFDGQNWEAARADLG